MQNPRKEKQPPMLRKFVFYFSLIMTLIYVGLGIFLIFADEEMMNLDIPASMRYLLGGILIIYGIVRFVRAYQQNSKKNEINE